MWIDFNDDYIFDDSEKVVADLYCYAPFTNYSTSLDVNSLAPLGDHRMRLRAVEYLTGFDACSEYFAGEVEDYTAEIVVPADMIYVSSTVTQTQTGSVSLGSNDVEIIGVQVVTSGSMNPLSLSSFTLNSNGTTDFMLDITNVKVYYTGTDPTFSAANLFGSSTDLTSPITGTQGLATGVNYFWVTYDINANAVINDLIDAECTSVIVGGTNYTPTVTAPTGNRVIGYCVPVDLYGCYFAYIDGVELNTLSNTFTYCNGNTNGYIEYEPIGNLTTNVEQGITYPITLKGNSFEMVGFGVWIDFNNDGDFGEADESVFFSPSIAAGVQTGNIAIPTSASLGQHAMRVRCNDNNTVSADQSCSQFNYGETEDYTINITQLQCSADFTLYPDSLIPHHYWALNLANGIPPISYYWIWGDGTYDTDPYPSHTYDTAGWYNICLIIIDSTGCGDSACASYEIMKLEQMNTVITVDVVDSIPDIATVVQNTDVLQLWSVFPNPVSENVFINYSLSTSAKVSVEIYDVLGNRLQQMINSEPAGEHHSEIDSQKLANGIYFLQIRAGDEIISQKIIVSH